ncbi:MAG TPA: hypothetical protein VFS39_07500 [Nitrospira sp.]|nr:hypothetical protein [Nitrospira sp.]
MATALTYTSPQRSRAQSDITGRILKTVNRKKVCHIDELLASCHDHTWDQVFLEVDRLSRAGSLCVFYQQNGDYSVTLPAA